MPLVFKDTCTKSHHSYGSDGLPSSLLVRWTEPNVCLSHRDPVQLGTRVSAQPLLCLNTTVPHSH